MLRQEDRKWKANLVYIVQSCLEYMCMCICINIFMFESWTGDVAQWVKMLASKPRQPAFGSQKPQSRCSQAVLKLLHAQWSSASLYPGTHTHIGQCKILRCL